MGDPIQHPSHIIGLQDGLTAANAPRDGSRSLLTRHVTRTSFLASRDESLKDVDFLSNLSVTLQLSTTEIDVSGLRYRPSLGCYPVRSALPEIFVEHTPPGYPVWPSMRTGT